MGMGHEKRGHNMGGMKASDITPLWNQRIMSLATKLFPKLVR
jgi:hypothetical protein